MYRKLGVLIKSSAFRVAAQVAALVLVSAGAVVSFGSPASAASAYFIRSELNNYCLDQHYNDAGQPTVTIFAWYGPCHQYGNQQWEFVHLGNNIFRIKNSRSGWCLSAPNGQGSQVFAEYCNDMPKQKWEASLNATGTNRLRNQLSQYCMEVIPPGTGFPNPFPEVWVYRCSNSNPVAQRWYWYVQD